MRFPLNTKVHFRCHFLFTRKNTVTQLPDRATVNSHCSCSYRKPGCTHDQFFPWVYQSACPRKHTVLSKSETLLNRKKLPIKIIYILNAFCRDETTPRSPLGSSTLTTLAAYDKTITHGKRHRHFACTALPYGLPAKLPAYCGSNCSAVVVLPPMTYTEARPILHVRNWRARPLDRSVVTSER